MNAKTFIITLAMNVSGVAANDMVMRVVGLSFWFSICTKVISVR